MRRYLINIILLVACTSVWATSYMPSSVPNPRDWDRYAYVANPDGILTSSEVASISQVARKIDEMVGVEVVTVVLDDISGQDAFTFAFQLFNLWGIGNKETNQGVLILFALSSRDIHITTGGGMEGLLPDARCSAILNDEMIPLLREGNYGEGLLAGNKAIGRLVTSPEAQAELLLGYRAKPVTESPWVGFSFVSLLVAVFLFLRHLFQPKCPHCHKHGVECHDVILHAATFDKPGDGEKIYTCPSCHASWKKKYTIPCRKITPSNGHTYNGSFGSGFGGSFGGGFSGGSFGGGHSFGGGAGGKF